MNARPTEAAADSSDGPASKKPRLLTEGEIDAGYDLCREAANFTEGHQRCQEYQGRSFSSKGVHTLSS
eukprot:4068068-Amphidinium_carterae.1